MSTLISGRPEKLLADRKTAFPVSQMSKQTSVMLKCHSCSGKFGLVGDPANVRKRVIERENVFRVFPKQQVVALVADAGQSVACHVYDRVKHWAWASQKADSHWKWLCSSFANRQSSSCCPKVTKTHNVFQKICASPCGGEFDFELLNGIASRPFG